MNVKALRHFHQQLDHELHRRCERADTNLAWLRENLHPYFFVTMQEHPEVVVSLAVALEVLHSERRIMLTDRENELILACQNEPGSIHRMLHSLRGRLISYAEVTHSLHPLGGAEHELEIQRFEFGRRDHAAIAAAEPPVIPAGVRRSVSTALRRMHPEYDRADLDHALQLLWLNNENYVRISPPERVARALWLYQQGRRNGGLYVETMPSEDVEHHQETRVVFAVGNPPDTGFLAQVVEVFNRLDLSIRRAYCLDISTGVHPYFLGTFYLSSRTGQQLAPDSKLFGALRNELYNTQILHDGGQIYTQFLARGVFDGETATFTNALIGFCHTNLAHNQPDRFDVGEVRRAFYAGPDMALELMRLFRLRFAPGVEDRETQVRPALERTRALVENYNTGHRRLDEVRRTVYRAALLLVTHTLKTNFFVPEKHALAFRLDPAYLKELGEEFTSDLPAGEPFRVTFFFGRHGAGYHIGFSDIARGGWRTIVCTTPDDFGTNSNRLFREVFVLAHTQHLKNKDIYEGGSKLAVVLDAHGLADPQRVTQRLYKLQYGFINAFLDVFTTRDGRAALPTVVDYYGEDEPVELGPDENMHDAMIEVVAREAERRGYVLGKGIMSSKRVGINHKEYGVTSLGVVRFAEIALEELGVDPRRDRFRIKFTGGTNGDVAGNALRLLIQRCPGAEVPLIVAGSGAAHDPNGLDREELMRLVLQADITDFDPERLSPGGFLLFRRQRRTEGLRELYRKLVRTPSGVEELWVTPDEFNREFDGLIFTVPAMLFLPAGGRPETIDDSNWERFFDGSGNPTCRAVVEGANSFLTPGARDGLQSRGVIVLRDASANKCGVISSSYEIIANLLMSDAEFLERKKTYVAQVLKILERRAEEEARLIFRRRQMGGTDLSFTSISGSLSREINDHYAELFAFFQQRPELAASPLYRKVLLRHLPPLVTAEPLLRRRVSRLPTKIRSAILAVELATSMVYRGDWKIDLDTTLRSYARHLTAEQS
ncbi:MAG: NAD-glutamate dehydrogenase [Deferrisomatales bacterium]|nr:NAD-glutamate dehydrogenase [Deferrisomatales bacterium]